LPRPHRRRVERLRAEVPVRRPAGGRRGRGCGGRGEALCTPRVDAPAAAGTRRPVMERRPVTFFSDGLRLDGELHLPTGLEPGDRRPAVITCSGYQGLKAIHPARFARALAPAGYVCLAFDYRGFGRSEGARGRLVPQEQCEDLRAGISFLETVPEVDPDAISLVGWALGGGVAIAAAVDDDPVRSVVAINPIADGLRSTRFMHDDDSWHRLLERVEADRRLRAVEG